MINNIATLRCEPFSYEMYIKEEKKLFSSRMFAELFCRGNKIQSYEIRPEHKDAFINSFHNLFKIGSYRRYNFNINGLRQRILKFIISDTHKLMWWWFCGGRDIQFNSNSYNEFKLMANYNQFSLESKGKICEIKLQDVRVKDGLGPYENDLVANITREEGEFFLFVLRYVLARLQSNFGPKSLSYELYVENGFWSMDDESYYMFGFSTTVLEFLLGDSDVFSRTMILP